MPELTQLVHDEAVRAAVEAALREEAIAGRGGG